MIDAGIFDAIKAAGVTLDGYAIDMVTGEIEGDIPDKLRDQLKAIIAAYVPAPPVVIVAAMDLYQRMTDDEYARMKAAVATCSAREQDVFNRADTFRSDAPLWPRLVQMGHQLYGEARTAELLGT